MTLWGVCPCGKRRYDSKRVARRVARRTETSASGEKVGRIDPYRCPHGPGWHVGHGGSWHERGTG